MINAAILYKEHAISFALTTKNSSIPNREIGVKLLFYSSGLAGWFFQYGIIKGFKIGDGNMLIMLLFWDTFIEFSVYSSCYDLKLKGLSDRTTLVLSNTRELDRVPSTK